MWNLSFFAFCPLCIFLLEGQKANLHLLRPFCPTVASTFWLLVLWGWEGVEAAALRDTWPSWKSDRLSLEPPFLLADRASIFSASWSFSHGDIAFRFYTSRFSFVDLRIFEVFAETLIRMWYHSVAAVRKQRLAALEGVVMHTLECLRCVNLSELW